MSAVRPLCWLPPSLATAVAAAFQGSVSDWTSAWGLPAVQGVQASLLSADAEEESGFEAVDLFMPEGPRWRNGIAQALFKLDAGRSAIVDAVIGRITESLQQQLQQRFPGHPSVQAPPGSPGHRGVQITAELLGMRCGVMLDAAQLRAGGWLKSAAQPPLQAVNFERASAGLAVPLVAELGRASVSISELMQLAPGDVLLLEAGLDDPLRLVSPGCSLALSAHLGAFADPPQRAARCLAS